MSEIKEGDTCSFFGCFAKIYGLYNHKNELFYIGYTLGSLDFRLKGHIQESKIEIRRHKKRTSFNNERKSGMIREAKFKVSIKCLEIFWVTGWSKSDARQKARKAERTRIDQTAKEGIQLTNKQGVIKKIVPDTFKDDYSMWSKMKEEIKTA